MNFKDKNLYIDKLVSTFQVFVFLEQGQLIPFKGNKHYKQNKDYKDN